MNKKYKLSHPLVRLVLTLKDRAPAAPAAAAAAAPKSNRATLEVKIYVKDPAAAAPAAGQADPELAPKVHTCRRFLSPRDTSALFMEAGKPVSNYYRGSVGQCRLTL